MSKETNEKESGLNSRFHENWNEKMYDNDNDDEDRYLFRGKAEAFLICNMEFESLDSPFVKWLRSEGFHYGHAHGNYGNCPWMYVNITTKLYGYGMPFVSYVRAVGNHAITIEEFKTIYAIYKKYEGRDLYDFHGGRFDYDAPTEK